MVEIKAFEPFKKAFNSLDNLLDKWNKEKQDFDNEVELNKDRRCKAHNLPFSCHFYDSTIAVNRGEDYDYLTGFLCDNMNNAKSSIDKNYCFTPRLTFNLFVVDKIYWLKNKISNYYEDAIKNV